MLKGGYDDEDDETLLRRVSKPTLDEVGRRVEVLNSLPITALRGELRRAQHVDLEDIIIALLGQRQAGAIAASAGNGTFTVDLDEAVAEWDPEGDQGGRRGAVGGATASLAATSPMVGRTMSVSSASSAAQTRRSSSSASHRRNSSRIGGSRRVVAAGRGKNVEGSERSGSSHTYSEPPVASTAANPFASPPLDPMSELDAETSSAECTVSPQHLSASAASGTLLDASTNRHTSVMTHRSVDHLDGEHEFRRQSGMPAMVALKNIYFYQDYISDRFSDGRPIQATINEIRAAGGIPATIPPLRIARRSTDGKYYSLCNRRLACYHHVFGKTRPDMEVPVLMRREAADHMLPQGDGKGTGVRVGGGVLLDGCLVWEIRHCLHQR